MTILLVTHYYSTHAGGIEIVAGALASRLGRSDTVTWAASDCDSLPDTTEGVAYLPMRSFNAIERVAGLPFPLWGPLSLLRLWRRAARCDVVHLHETTYMGNWFAYLCARMHHRPVVITQHVGFIPYRHAAHRLALRFVHRTVGRAMLGSADAVLFISPVVQSYFESFVRFRRPPELVLNGVDTSVYRARTAGDRERARAALALDSSRPVLLFVGRFVEKKGLHILHQAARTVADATWLFAGWGPVDPGQWNAPNVRVYGDRSGASLVSLYHAADLLVLPSVGEGLPLVVQEAMSCGVPVLVGDETAVAVQGPPTAVLACQVTGMDASSTCAAAIREFLARPVADRDAAGAAAASFARQRWSWDGCAAQYRRVFAGLPPPAKDSR
jgi:glycosyltransferase involved in cell wall biosynthesis